MPSVCSTCASFLVFLGIISSFLLKSAGCYVSLNIAPYAKDRKLTYIVSNSSNPCFANNTTLPYSSAGRDGFNITNVTDSTITVRSDETLLIMLEKCADSGISSLKKMKVGLNYLENLDACTTYRLLAEEKCCALVHTSFKAPSPVTNIGASFSNGILNLSWHSDNSTTNCISHYEINLSKDAKQTTKHESLVSARHYSLPATNCEKFYFSVTTVDIRGQKSSSRKVGVVVRDNVANITETNMVSRYSDSVHGCLVSDVDYFDKSERETDAADKVRLLGCDFNKLEYLWIGGSSVNIRSNFSCAAIKCMAVCCYRHKDRKCVQGPMEYWYYNCTRNVIGGTTIFVTGGKLLHNEVYYCSVEVVTVGNVPYQQEGSFRTKDGSPEAPGPVWVTNITASSFLISWEPSPHVDKDPVDYYILTVAPDQPGYRYNQYCRFPKEKILSNTTTVSPQPVTGLLPYFVYKVYVEAFNSFGSARSSIDSYTTKPSDPELCESVSKTDVDANSTVNNPAFIFNWTEPCYWNAPPKDTMLKITGRRPDNRNKTFDLTKTFNTGNVRNSFRFNASRDFVYLVEIYARVEKARSKHCADPWNITIPPGLSSVTSKWATIRPEVLTPDDGGSPLAAIPLHWNMLDDTNGTVKHVAIMVAEKGRQGVRERRYLPLPNWPNARNWQEAMAEDHVLLYQATPKYWCMPLFEDSAAVHAYNLGSDSCVSNETSQATPKRSSTDEVVSFNDRDHLRSESIFQSSANATGSDSEDFFYCNGPLRRNIEYVVRLRVFTAAGYSDSDEIYFRTGHVSEDWAEFYNQFWFYAMFPAFSASVLLTMIWIGKKRKGASAVASAPSPDTIASCAGAKCRHRCRGRSISPQKLPEVASRLLAHKCTLEKEFEELNAISIEWAAKVPCTVGLMKENRLKNRYADVVPYDYNRVKLSSESTSQTDYINASFIKGFSMDTEYIACQGPTVETSNDFWQMVFDQNVCFIVMLTSLVENGMAKCCQYFSELCENKEWMDFTVKCSSRLDLLNYTVRELQLYKKTNSEKRFIQHFQFRDWPDFGCPRDIDGILEFCDVLRENLCLKGDSKTVVHCSAGIGRTGTLIALDILLQFVHYNRKLDILRTVVRLREQRQWMVRTADQYAFIYRCLKTATERHFSSES